MAGDWDDATAYIQNFTRARHRELQELMRECRPNAGYGRNDDVEEASIFLFDYVDVHLLNVGIPEDYATAESAAETLQRFIAEVEVRERAISAFLKEAAKTDVGPPYNASVLYQQLKEYRRAAERAVKLFSKPAVSATSKGEAKMPTPPNWANIVSAVVALVMMAAAGIFWASRLSARIDKLETRMDAIEAQARAAPEAAAHGQTCRDLAGQFVQLRRDFKTTDAEAVDAMMVRLGCEKPK